MKLLVIFFAFVGQAFAQVGPADEFIRINKQRAEEMFKIVADNGPCAKADMGCIADHVINRGIKTATDVAMGTDMVRESGLRALRNTTTCDNNCKSTLIIHSFNYQLKIIEAIKLEEMYSYTLLKENDPKSELIKATEDFSLFKITQGSMNRMMEMAKSIEPASIKEPAIKAVYDGFEPRVQKVRSAQFLVGSYLAKMPEMGQVYERFMKTKDPTKQAEHDRLFSEFKRYVTGKLTP